MCPSTVLLETDFFPEAWHLFDIGRGELVKLRAVWSLVNLSMEQICHEKDAALGCELNEAYAL